MKRENYKECSAIIDKINQIEKIIDSITDSDNIAFINQNCYPLFEIKTSEPNQSALIHLSAVNFKKEIIELLTFEINQLNKKLETL